LDARKFGVTRCGSSTVARARARYAGALSCWNKVVTRHSAYHWQQYDVIMTSQSSIKEVSKTYHQKFLLFNNNEITACIADLFNSFCEEVQQQTIFVGR